MKSLINIILAAAVVLLSCPGAVAADWKVLEQSEKKAPQWTQTAVPEGYISVTMEAPSLQEARQMAEQEILRTIIQAVAANVNFSTSQSATNNYDNGNVNATETFTSEYAMAAAKLPFIKGVSLSEAKGTYWERREDKKSHRQSYIFTVLYPLSETELADMRSQFNRLDKQMTDALQHWQGRFYEVASADEVSQAVGKLIEVEDYFFDSVRKKEAGELLRRYRDCMKSVTLTADKVGPGKYMLRTELRGRPFAVGRVPEVTSECANKITVTPLANGYEFEVSYSTEDCLDTEDNKLTVSLRAGSARINKNLPI